MLRRKIDIQNKVTEDLRQSIRDFCTLLVAAINKYYAFGERGRERQAEQLGALELYRRLTSHLPTVLCSPRP